jgi:opacity protein-like surface antigen
MKKTPIALAALAAAALAGAAQAQTAPVSPFSLEVRGGLALPTGDFGDLVDNGYTVGAEGNFMFTRQLGVYAGFTYNAFSLGEFAEAFGADGELRDYGFNGGVTAMFATPTLPVTPFLKGGLVYHKAEINFDDDELNGDDDDSEFGLGFEVGGGVMIPLGPRLSFTPGIMYSSYKPGDEDDTGDDNDLDLSHIRLDVGLRIRF